MVTRIEQSFVKNHPLKTLLKLADAFRIGLDVDELAGRK